MCTDFSSETIEARGSEIFSKVLSFLLEGNLEYQEGRAVAMVNSR